jgi:hypothetical protein
MTLLCALDAECWWSLQSCAHTGKGKHFVTKQKHPTFFASSLVTVLWKKTSDGEIQNQLAVQG